MTKATIAGGACVTVLVLLALAAGYRALYRDVHPAAAPSPGITASTAPAAAETHQGFLYGRITTVGGATYEGRLRWGGDQEAFWGDYFNGVKLENPWLAHVPPERLPTERPRPIEIFGIEIARRERPLDVGRRFMARFGEIARIEARGRRVRVTLKSGTVFDLDRFDASDFDDGVRVWDGRRGVADLRSLRIRTIELLPTPSPTHRSDAAPYRLHGTVRTRQGDFTGFVGWNRDECVGADELDGRTAEGELSLRFDTIRSIARRSQGSALVTLLDGGEIVLSGTTDVGTGNRGISVDDRRYGRVRISWDAFERVDFSDLGSVGSGPAYGDFPPGRPLMGTVTTRDGRRLAGRLVYDLDESETTDTLDADHRGVNYTVPFGLIASIAPLGREERGAHGARVTLHDGEELNLERTGDLSERNAGMLIFVDGRERPDYVPWTDVEQVELDRPPAMYPPLGGRVGSGPGAAATMPGWPASCSRPGGSARFSPGIRGCSPGRWRGSRDRRRRGRRSRSWRRTARRSAGAPTRRAPRSPSGCGASSRARRSTGASSGGGSNGRSPPASRCPRTRSPPAAAWSTPSPTAYRGWWSTATASTWSASSSRPGPSASRPSWWPPSATSSPPPGSTSARRARAGARRGSRPRPGS